MSCRSTNAGSAFIAYARWENGKLLSDSACLSIFHELRRGYRGSPSSRAAQYSRDDYLALVSAMRHRVETQAGLSSRRKMSILRRLDKAATEPTPDQEMIFALEEVRNRVFHRTEMLDRFLKEMAHRTRTPYSEVLSRFRDLESSAPRERTHRSPTAFTTIDEQELDRYGLGREQGTAYAALQLLKETRDIELSLFRQRKQRVRRIPFAEPAPLHTTGLLLVSAGYDERNGRLEIGVRDGDIDKSLCYRRVPADLWDSIDPSRNADSALAAEVWAKAVRGIARFEYASPYDAAQDGVAPRCPHCGEFADTSHHCPVSETPRDLHSWSTRSRWSNQVVPTRQLVPAHDASDEEYCYEDATATISLPAMKELRQAVSDGPVRIRDVSYRHSQAYLGRAGYGIRTFTTTGDIVIWRDDTDSVSLNLSELRCGCPEYEENYACQHTRDVERAVLERLHASRALRSEDDALRDEDRLRRAQQRAEAAAAEDWTRDPQHYREAASSWRQDSDVLYSTDFASFRDALGRAKDSVRPDGKPLIPYFRENVLDGAAQRGSGTAFGVEIEYEFPEEWSPEQRRDANDRIARRLNALGLTWSDRMQPAQTSKGRGFRDRQKEPSGEGNWTLEKDGSVNGGELISPGLYDEPETWTNLDLAVDVLTSEGAVATKRAGLHVHVGTADFRADPAAYTALARLLTQHEDVIYRLSSDPARGTHRKGRFARPVPDVPPEGFQDAAELSRWQGPGKYWLANFNTVRGGPHDHPEFRVYDATLDPGAIQAQIKISLGLTEAAKRLAYEPPAARGKEPLGSHAARRSGRRTRRALTDEEMEQDTATTRSFLDTLFRRREDKEHLVAIFAHTKWSR